MFLPLKRLVTLVFALLVSVAGAQAGPSIVVDVQSGQVLSADRATDPWHPASITKLMTLYVAARAIREGRLGIQSTLTMSKYASRTPPSKMGFKPGTLVTMDNAFKMLIVKSANDIAVGIAERVSGSEQAFVTEMNQIAREIGMTGSNFVNPHGLPNKQQIVTARDMAILGIALHKEFPELAPVFKLAGIRFGKANLRSHNLLVEHYRDATGMKTGFTCSSGLTMVASAERNGQSLVAVVLGEASSIDRAEKAAYLLETGFRTKKKKKPTVTEFRPAPTRATPVDFRKFACQVPRKVRKFQIVVPQPRPEKKLFKSAKYESPQRKIFYPNLGDKSHPQGALVYTPGRRSYRSHILQPRVAGKIVRVRAGPFRGASEHDLAINVSPEAKARFAASLPKPRVRPEVVDLASLTQKPLKNQRASAAASAFVSDPSSVAENTPSLHQKALARAQAAERLRNGAPSQETTSGIGGPLVLEFPDGIIDNSVYFPRPNPLR